MARRAGRRNEHSRDELRALSIDAAAEIVRTDGLAGLTARRLATRIGYSAGSLYVVFANLDDIILHVNAGTLAALHDRISAVAVEPANPRAAVHALAHTYLEFARTDAERWRAVFDHRLPADMRLPGWYLHRVATMFAVVSQPLALVNPRLGQTELRLAARALWSAVHGVCILGLDDKLDLTHEDDVHDVLTLLVETYLAGLSARRSAGPETADAEVPLKSR